MGLFIRTIGIARARTKIGLANLVYNMQRMVWLLLQAAVEISAAYGPAPAYPCWFCCNTQTPGSLPRHGSEGLQIAGTDKLSVLHSVSLCLTPATTF